MAPLKVRMPPPVLMSPPWPDKPPEKVMLKGMPLTSAACTVKLPLRLVSVMGMEAVQLAVAARVPPERVKTGEVKPVTPPPNAMPFTSR